MTNQWMVLKGAVFFFALIPLARLFFLGFADQLTANPIEFVTRSTGTWTLVFLCLTLAVTPVRRFTGWNGLIKLRRMLGLYTFFYACLHFTTFVWFDHFFEASEILKDIVKRPFITVGFAAFLLLIPLAITSTNAWVRRLGGKRWQALHRSIYVIAVLAVLHFWWHKAGKNDLFEPGIYAAIVGVLLLLRVWWKLRSTRKQALSGK